MAISMYPITTAVTLQDIFDLCVYIVCMYVYICGKSMYIFSMVSLYLGQFSTQILTKDIPLLTHEGGKWGVFCKL